MRRKTMAQSVASGRFADPGSAHGVLYCRLQNILVHMMPAARAGGGIGGGSGWGKYKLPRPRLRRALVLTRECIGQIYFAKPVLEILLVLRLYFRQVSL